MEDEKRITPHGFRYTIATLLDEKDVTHETIKYLLGHSNTENVEFYLRKHRKEIHKIRKALNEIENELESHLEQTHYAQKTQIPIDPSFNISGHEEKAEENELPFPEDFLVRLAAESPKMFEKIMTDHLNNKSYPKSS